MPALWTQTIEAHRAAVREAILDSTWALVTEHGPLSVSMSQVAEATGIGRATLYKYFADIETILHAWHERQVRRHLADLAQLSGQADDIRSRLESVLEAYARIARQREHHGSEIAATLHRHEHVASAYDELAGFFRELLTQAARAGYVRADIPSDELADYCVHALETAGSARSEAAVRRLVTLVLAALQPSATASASG